MNVVSVSKPKTTVDYALRGALVGGVMLIGVGISTAAFRWSSARRPVPVLNAPASSSPKTVVPEKPASGSTAPQSAAKAVRERTPAPRPAKATIWPPPESASQQVPANPPKPAPVRSQEVVMVAPPDPMALPPAAPHATALPALAARPDPAPYRERNKVKKFFGAIAKPFRAEPKPVESAVKPSNPAVPRESAIDVLPEQ